jgi:uncharacterized heparinase superfamily protein
MSSKVICYFNTLRYLRPGQIFGRLWFRLYRPKLDATASTPSMRERPGQWQPPAARLPVMLGPLQFRLLNYEYTLPEHGGWDCENLEKLWRYNLHYFDDLNAKGSNFRLDWHRVLLVRWIVENPVPIGTAWESYPTSLRVVNWIKWLLSGHVPPHGFMQSLATQVRWLAVKLEWHLMGNHLFANAKALVFAGLFFDGHEAKQWLAKGLRIIERELPEQVLADGGHFERSPMYHMIFIEDLLDLLNIVNLWPATIDQTMRERWADTTQKMFAWLDGMIHPDGRIALFNDAAFGITPEPSELRAYADRLGIKTAPPCSSLALEIRHWDSSGYIRLSSPHSAVAFLDVAKLGPDYLPGHGHADTLSFELSVYGQRVVVNGGTSCYGNSAQRLRQRSTVAHSTVELANQSSSEVWGGFRVARRAYPFDLQVNQDTRFVRVCCAHNGYARLRGGGVVHRREWTMDANRLTINDTLNSGLFPGVARFILHPSCRLTTISDYQWRVTLPNGRYVQINVTKGKAGVEQAHYSPEFGKVVPTRCLAVKLVDQQARTDLTWN